MADSFSRFGWSVAHTGDIVRQKMDLLKDAGCTVAPDRLNDEVRAYVEDMIESTSYNSTARSASNRSVHLLRPSGGGPQLQATSLASAFPSSLG